MLPPTLRSDRSCAVSIARSSPFFISSLNTVSARFLTARMFIDRAASHYSVSSEIRYYPAKLFDCFGSPVQQRGSPAAWRVARSRNFRWKPPNSRPPVQGLRRTAAVSRAPPRSASRVDTGESVL